MNTRLLLSVLFTLACAARLLAQTPAPASAKPAATAAAPAAASTVTVQGSEPAHGSASRDKDTLSVDFPDEDIKSILRNVADLFELNLVVPDTLTGKTSIKLRDVTWRQIFQVILSPVGFTYVEEGNIIKIISNETLLDEPTTTDVIILNSAKAVDIKPTIDGLVDTAKGGKIVIDTRSNALVITERPSRMTRIRATIELLDKATAQVMIESKFIEVTDRDIKNIGVNWASLDRMQFGVGGINKTFSRSSGRGTSSGSNTAGVTNASNNSSTNRTTGATTTSGTNNDTTNPSTTGSTTTTNTGGITTTSTSSNSGTLLTFDANTGAPIITPIPPPGAVSSLTTTIAPSTQTNSTVSVINGTTTGGTNASTANTVNDAITNGLASGASTVVNDLISLTNTGSTGRLASAVFSASDFNVIISALKTQNNTKIVSNPTIVTLNNTEASINVGEEDPIPNFAYNEQRGTFEVSGFTYKPIGINLKVTPQVNARGDILLKLAPEVSQKNGSTSFGGAGGAVIPIIATRKVSTQVSLKDGYTMGIGGLITSSRDHGGNKVPLLGSIPLLGRLFSSSNVNDSTTNLLIFITARTVSADGASPEEVFSPEAISSVGMTREDLPGHRAKKGTNLFPTAQEVKDAEKKKN